MPKMNLSEAEAENIRQQRKIRALQAVAWNEAIEACIYVMCKKALSPEQWEDEMRGLLRPTNGSQ